MSRHDFDTYRQNSTPTLLKYGPKDDVQRESIKFLLGYDQYSFTRGCSQLLLALNTGAGKTYLGIAFMAYINAKAIIIASSIGWLEQWKERIVEHSNIEKNEVYMICGAASIISLMKRNPSEIDRNKIYLVTHSTLSNLASRRGWGSVGDLFRHLGIGVKIFDEAHLYFEAMGNIDFYSNTFKTVYMTATPERGELNDDRIFQFYFKNVPRIDLFDPEKDPRTLYIPIRYNSHMTQYDIKKCTNIRGFQKVNYARMVMGYPNFFKICHIVFDFILKLRGRILIFMASNESIQELYDWIELNYPELRGNIGIYTCINENKRRALANKIILTTSLSAGEALDIPDLICSVQLAEPMKSRPKCRQRLGRTRIRGSFFIDVIDQALETFDKYYIYNLPMYEKYAITIKDEKELKKFDFTSDLKLNKRSKEILDTRRRGISPFVLGCKPL